MALKKKQKNQLNSILNDLERTKKYLLKDSTIVAGITTITSMPENTFINKKTNETAVQFNKHVGTELCYYWNAVNSLNIFLENN